VRSIVSACLLAIAGAAHAADQAQVIVGIMDDRGGRETGATVYMPPSEYLRYHEWLMVRQTKTGDAPTLQVGRWDMWPGGVPSCRKPFGYWH